VRDGLGKIVRWYGTCTDIEEIVQARIVLSRSREELEALVTERTSALEKANDALRHAQKMEAVGQLTGGIAHDFNNMLTGVIGALDIMKRRIAAKRTDDLDRFMEAASTSAQRAAALTSRLLAFARRQSLDSKPIDAGRLVNGLGDLLQQTVRENVVLDFRTTPDLPLIVADANQLENAILNLVINARDAMPDGGRLVVSTSIVEVETSVDGTDGDLKPGRYVSVAVSDTGVGMSRDVLERVFEPFYTTKPLGQGTGLGLSMIYGFVRQSGGEVRIESQPGAGTTVTMLLPMAAADARIAELAATAAIAQGRGETVLVVEDDESVRLLVIDVLHELGYAALESSDPFLAIEALRSSEAIELMVSDVGMPGMSGRELAEIARAERPDLPILFVTGYAENAAIRSEFLGRNMAMITKPFAVDALATKINEMLRPARAARASVPH